MKNGKRIFITGGHLTPALAVAQVLSSRGHHIYYMGRKQSFEGDMALSQEYQLTHRLGYTFLPLTTGRLQRVWTEHTLKSLLKIPLGFIQSAIYIKTYKPHVILSFGGYLAVPIILTGWIWGIPAVTHDQSIVPGLANRILSAFVKRVCVSWDEAASVFSAHKVIMTGNPVRREIFKTNKSLPVPLTKPLLYVTGGNQGAHAINTVVEKALPLLLKEYSVIHQCGNAAEFSDYHRLSKLKLQLPQDLAERYYPVEYIGPEEIGWVLNKSQYMVTRAGANITTEVIMLRKPVIFIPLPGSSHGEQEAHANYLLGHQAALLILQPDLTPERLIDKLADLRISKTQIVRQLDDLAGKMPQDAAVKVADVVESVA